MKMELYPHPFIKEDYDNLEKMCPLNSYKVCDIDQIPITLPSDLANKSIKAIVVGSGDSYNAVYMINILRIDRRAIDQQPLIVAYHSGDIGIDLTAGFIQHGDWPGRTVYPGTGFFQAIEGSGIANYYPYIGIPEKGSGDIKELKPDSHNNAFWNGVKMIRVGR